MGEELHATASAYIYYPRDDRIGSGFGIEKFVYGKFVYVDCRCERVTDTFMWQVRETIGGAPFKGPHDILLNMTVDEVQQWNLVGSEQHPFHMHVNHMQFVNVDGPLLVPGWNHIGDWVDTVSSELIFSSHFFCSLVLTVQVLSL